MRRAAAIAFAATTIAAGLGVHAASARPASAHVPSAAQCRRDYYKNVSGHCVHRPVHAAKAPAGATAKCRDGTYSFSQHASGTCSHHGGVAVWIHHP